jgi:hypothetical protein
MEAASQEEREALAQVLENVAKKLRDEDGVVTNYKCQQRRPMDTDVDNERFRHTGLYTFTCSLDMQYHPGEWNPYGDACKDIEKPTFRREAGEFDGG